MKDLVNNRYCKHKIIDEELTIQGTSPNYFSILKYYTDRNTDNIEIRNWTSTEALTNYTYTRNGFTNWGLDATRDNIINFNTDGLCFYGFLDGSTNIYPSVSYKINYNTKISHCPKCSGTGVIYDILIDETGVVDTVEGTTKLQQILSKALLTVKKNNPFHEEYGSTINESIGQKFTTYAQIILQNSIQDAIEVLMDEQASNTDLPLSEVILRVEEILVVQDSNNKNQINVIVSVTSGSYEEVKAGVKLLIGG